MTLLIIVIVETLMNHGYQRYQSLFACIYYIFMILRIYNVLFSFAIQIKIIKTFVNILTTGIIIIPPIQLCIHN